MDVIKSSRFWLALIIIVGAFVLAVLKLISGSEAMAVTGGILGGFGVAKAGGGGGAAGLLLVLCLAASGCGTTTVGANLHRAHLAVEAVDSVVISELGKRCLAEAEKCKEAPAATCTGWQTCDATRGKYKAAVDAIESQIAVVNRLCSELGVR